MRRRGFFHRFEYLLDSFSLNVCCVYLVGHCRIVSFFEIIRPLRNVYMTHTAQNHYVSAAEIATRWSVHRATVLRFMKRFGCSGIKFGESDQSARRFAWSDVYRIEKLLGIGNSRRDRNPTNPRMVQEKYPSVQIGTAGPETNAPSDASR